MGNYVNLLGRLTKDVECKYTQNQMAVARFSVALDRGKDKDGNSRGADFPNCVAFGRTAENMEKFSGKGLRVSIIGHIQTVRIRTGCGGTTGSRSVICTRRICSTGL